MNGNIIKISHFPKGAPKDTVLTKTRTVLDNICRSCTVEEDITSGNYVLDAEFLVDSGGLWNELVEDLEVFEKLVDVLEDDEDVQKVYHNVSDF